MSTGKGTKNGGGEYCLTGYLDITRDEKEGQQKDGKMKSKRRRGPWKRRAQDRKHWKNDVKAYAQQWANRERSGVVAAL